MPESIAQNEDYAKAIFTTVPSGIVVVDAETHVILDINKAALDYIGLKKEDVVGNVCHNFICPAQKGACPITDLHQTVDKSEKALLSKGVKIPILKTVIPTTLNGKPCLLESFIDIRERKKMEESLKEYSENLEKRVYERTSDLEAERDKVKGLLDSKNELIKQLSHDLRTPLTPIIALIPAIKSKMTDEKQKEMFEVIEGNIGYMHKLLIDTLNLAKLDTEANHLDKKPLNLHNLVEGIISDNTEFIKKKDMKAVNAIPENLEVFADELKIKEVFHNLLSNAVKYSQPKGTVMVYAEPGNERYIISVKDDGIGVDKEDIGKLFTEFYKVDESRHDLDSSGLGLAICRRIIEKHGGEIWAESPGLGQGTTIKFTLPNNKEAKKE